MFAAGEDVTFPGTLLELEPLDQITIETALLRRFVEPELVTI